jgi:elongator complex protein 1
MLRKHKIDLNLICDVNPEKFRENISKFVSEIRQVDYLNLFINGLSEQPSKELEFLCPVSAEDRIKMDFSDVNPFADKINSICDLMRNEISSLNENNEMLLPILTTYIKKTPQELAQVLLVIKKLKEGERGERRAPLPPHLNQET